MPRNVPSSGNDSPHQKGIRKYLIHGVSWLLVFRTLSLGIGLVTNLILARLLLAQGLGIYSFVMALINLLVVPALFGFVPLIVRETARLHQQESWSKIANIIQSVRGKLVLVAFAIACVSAVAFNFIFKGSLSDYKPVFMVSLPLIPIIVAMQLNNAILRGMHHVVASQLSEILFRRIVFVGIVWVISLITSGTGDPRQMMIVYVGASLMALLCSIILMRIHLPVQVLNVVTEKTGINWIRASLPFFMLNGINLINHHTDTLMIGFYLDPTAVGIYHIAVRCAEVVVMILAVINLVIQPSIVRLYHSGSRDKLQKLITHAAYLGFCAGLSIFVGLVLFGDWVLGLFGDEFYSGNNALLILALGYLFSAFVGAVGTVLSMTGHEKSTLKGISLGAVVNVTLNLILIPQLGIEGAAIATAASVVVSNATLVFIARKKTSLNMTVVGGLFK